ncbi:MAG TPA: phosphoglucomutase/phosphomannomutase family protein [Oligoflexia bacterium]|nr:phosphoglucomutase/phosphomannomutase family protein [Oligoflexia bacterium]HMR25629.1 phosphoglucomutase/phosphomannomutase family protein [Oligoflexia bacterium]
MTQIKFGTDGWRAEIAKEFTFENLGRVAMGVANQLKQEKPELDRIIVGYDKRFLSEQFAQWTAACFAHRGYTVLMTQEAMPTPLLSWCAKYEKGVAGSIVITASHNPPTWNGFKFKETFGGSASVETTEKFEQEIAKVDAQPFEAGMFSQYEQQGKIQHYDPLAQYTEKLLSLVDVEAIKKAKFKVAIDTMYGSASKHFAPLLERLGIATHSLHTEDNPGFGGIAPEPTEKNLLELRQLIAKGDFNCGFANDGDADRLGAVDEKGEYFSTQKILSTVYWHMIYNRKKQWNVSRSVSTTRMVDVIAEANGLKCIETKVGFKYIAEQMVEGHAQIGGEESGGIGTDDHLPERDGFMTALLLLEAMAVTGKSLSQIYRHICQSFRPYEFIRKDLKVPQALMQKVMQKLKETDVKQWGDKMVASTQTVDGFKYYTQDGAWLLIRPSGTEPLFRIYAEAETIEASEALINAAMEFVETC